MSAEGCARTGVLAAFWLVCLAIVGGVVGIGLAAAPSRDGWHEVLTDSMLFSVPYLVAAVMAWFLRKHTVALVVLFLGVLMVGALGTLGRFAMLQEHWQYVEAEAAGKRLMNCGPPVMLLWLAVEFLGMAGFLTFGLVAVVFALVKPAGPGDPERRFGRTRLPPPEETGSDEFRIQRFT